MAGTAARLLPPISWRDAELDERRLVGFDARGALAHRGAPRQRPGSDGTLSRWLSLVLAQDSIAPEKS